MRTHARSLAAAVVILVLGLAACGDDDDSETSDATTTTAADTSNTEATDDAETTTTTPLSPEDEVLRDYAAANASFSAAANPPNPDSPDLAAHYTGVSLTRVQNNLRGVQSTGAGMQNSVELHPSGVSITGDVAVLVDCFIDRTQMVDLATGQPVGQAGETTVHVDVRLERVDGVWKIAEQTEKPESCTPG